MIKPNEVFKDNPSMLEREIDDEIVNQAEQRQVGDIVVNMLLLPSFYEEGWKQLRDEYQKYWITKERAISSGGKWVTYTVVFETRTKKSEEVSMIDQVFFPDDK